MSGRNRIVTAALIVVFAGPGASAGADSSSLYRGPAPRPGPDILYEPVADAPQLQNAGIWHAPPILISGASAYRDGEYLYQDFLYDDHGARGLYRDPNDPRWVADRTFDLFSQPYGTITYPSDPVYADNAADLVEFRVKPLAGATAFRVTLNTVKDVNRVAFTIALGSSPAPVAFPYGANIKAPAAYFLTVHGDEVDLRHAATGRRVAPAPTVRVDVYRRQFEVRVPHSAWDPGSRRVRMAIGVGLWNPDTGRYLVPGTTRSETAPGGAIGLPKPAAFFNVGFRHNEPMPLLSNVPRDTGLPAWWRDQAQGESLAAGDISRFADVIDFAKLKAGVNDDMPGQPQGVPQTGPMDRILASHFETQQGENWQKLCGAPVDCQGEFRGRLQPYAIYVPDKPKPAGGWGLTVMDHSLSASYNQYLNSRNQSQVGDRGTGSIVITPEGRGPDTWYWGAAGADTFEVWADVAKHYRLNPDYTAITGYSMGGYATYKLAGQYPDLFAKAAPVNGAEAAGSWLGPGTAPVPYSGTADETPTITLGMLDSFRNIPVLMWNTGEDELVPYPSSQAMADRLDQLGYRYEFDNFQPGDHFSLAFNDQYQPLADWLGTDTVDRNPSHVTFVASPRMNFPDDGTVADHAYWLGDVRVRDASGSEPLGTIDVRSKGFGVGDPMPSGTQRGAGVLTGGAYAPLAHTSQYQTWGPTPTAPARDQLDIKAKNIAAVTIYPERARVGCDAQLNINSDGPLSVTLAGCDRTVRVDGGP